MAIRTAVKTYSASFAPSLRAIAVLLDLKQVSYPQAMCPNVYVIGAQSSGKTTLVTALDAHFSSRHHCCSGREQDEEKGKERRGDVARLAASHSYHHHHQHHRPVIIREVARKLLDERSWTGVTITNLAGSALALQKLIIHAQSWAEHQATAATSPATPSAPPSPPWYNCQPHDAAMPGTQPLFISDRSAIDPIVYARQYVGLQESRALMELPEWREMRARMVDAARSLVVLCEPNLSWLVDDGVRLMPQDKEEWLATHGLFLDVLEEAEVPFAILSGEVGNIDDRVGFVLGHLQSLERAAEG